MRGKLIYLLQENFTTKTCTCMWGYDAIEIYVFKSNFTIMHNVYKYLAWIC
jgi:hypothetical protein